jgi:hypothetical protein
LLLELDSRLALILCEPELLVFVFTNVRDAYSTAQGGKEVIVSRIDDLAQFRNP